MKIDTGIRIKLFKVTKFQKLQIDIIFCNKIIFSII